MDKTGREIIPCQYDQAYNFSDGLAKVYLSIWDPDMPEPNNPFPLPSDTKRFFIDKTGKEVLTAVEDWDVFYDGLARIKRDGKTGYVNKEGKEVIPCKYDGAAMFCEGMAIVCEIHFLPEEEWTEECRDYSTKGFIDKTGREVTPCKYDEAHDFHDDLAMVREGRTWGFIDKTGQMVIEYKTDPAPAPAKFNAPDDELPF